LTQASGAYGTVAYRYDPLGNLLEKEGLQMSYGAAGAKPHAATAMTGPKAPVSAMLYDANGNLVEKGSPVSSLLSQVVRRGESPRRGQDSTRGDRHRYLPSGLELLLAAGHPG